MEAETVLAEPPAAQAAPDDATSAVTDLYRGHALGLMRLALVMVGDRGTAEDVVQEAFAGLYGAGPVSGTGRRPSRTRVPPS